MTTIEALPGDVLYEVLEKAVAAAPARFSFNDWEFETIEGEMLGDARQRFKEQHDVDVLTRQQMADKAGKDLDDMHTRQAAAISEAKVMTETEMRDLQAPTPQTIYALDAFITELVDRPHDYGTCVYAMSLAATAALNYVANKLGVSGFQASCADMDILRRTRGFDWGRIISYENLLYPQYCDDEHFPSWRTMLNDADIRTELAKRAAQLLIDSPNAHEHVVAHWKRLAARA